MVDNGISFKIQIASILVGRHGHHAVSNAVKEHSHAIARAFLCQILPKHAVPVKEPVHKVKSAFNLPVKVGTIACIIDQSLE